MTTTDTSRPRLLLAEADAPARRDAALVLEAEGFAVTPLGDLAEAWRQLDGADALLLDAGLARAGLVAAIRRLRHRRPRLVLAVQASPAEPEEEIAAANAGADLYWAKPLHPRLAAARLRAALRLRGMGMAAPLPPGPGTPLGEGLVLEAETRSVRRPDGSRIRLARRELALLRCLAGMAGDVAPREDIAADVFGRIIAYGDRSVDNLVLGLRRKLGMDAEHGAIRAVRGVGYQLVVPEALAPAPVQNRSVNPAFSR